MDVDTKNKSIANERQMKIYLLNSKCVIILVLRWYNSNSNNDAAKLSLSLSLLHARTHTRSLLSIKRVEIGTRPRDRTRLFGTRSTFRTLSAARRFYRAKIGTNRLVPLGLFKNAKQTPTPSTITSRRRSRTTITSTFFVRKLA